VIVQKEGTLEGSGRALEGMTEDRDQDRPGVELGEDVTQSLRTRERVVLETALLESGGGREVVAGAECNGQDVGVVRVGVRRHLPRLRID
jgi:hypothetical protein